ncbi:DNA alkylation repair protein [Enterococcus sp. AZ072]|uniref:DNA alkylation repair protein n=1 Tax=unclassified Enterococcus TaxID=2608891 RepID=UPI003D27EE69
MPTLLKDQYYNYDSVNQLALNLQAVDPTFPTTDFINDVMNETWEELALKARMRQITLTLGKYLPPDYEKALHIIDQLLANYPTGFSDFSLMYFPDFVEVYGQAEEHWDLSIAGLERYTPFSTAEFAVRPFIIQHEKRMMDHLAVWAKHDNEHVRRLASEGCRPRLPWGQALTSFKNDPTPVLAILEQLKADPSLYVRKSVANNLNDISKDHPDLVVKIAQNWYGNNPRTDWIVKHGCRTLLKKSNHDVLSIFGFSDANCLEVTDFALDTDAVNDGQDLNFSFQVEAKKTTKVRLEYGVDYVKANATRNRKIFQIAETTLQAGEKKFFTKKRSFARVSTRKHYPGTHSITLIMNGIEQGTLDFNVLSES